MLSATLTVKPMFPLLAVAEKLVRWLPGWHHSPGVDFGLPETCHSMHPHHLDGLALVVDREQREKHPRHQTLLIVRASRLQIIHRPGIGVRPAVEILFAVMVPNLACCRQVATTNEEGRVSLAFSLPLLAVADWSMASGMASFTRGDLNSITTTGKPFRNSTMSGMMWCSVPRMRTLNWQTAMKRLLSRFLKSTKWTVGLFSPVCLFRLTLVFSSNRLKT